MWGRGGQVGCAYLCSQVHVWTCMCKTGDSARNHPICLFHSIHWVRFSQSNPYLVDMPTLASYLTLGFPSTHLPKLEELTHLLGILHGYWGDLLEAVSHLLSTKIINLLHRGHLFCSHMESARDISKVICCVYHLIWCSY